MPKTIQRTRPMAVELSLRVGTYDIDFAGVVSNIVYIRWLEDLRSKMLADHLPLEGQLARGYTPILASTSIQYKRPVRLFDQPIGTMWMSELGRARWTVEAEILLAGEPAATAIQTGTFVDLATMRVLKVPEELRAQYARDATSP